MQDETAYITKLQRHSIRATAIRLLILQQMRRSDEALSLSDLERLLPTIDKSTISRTLSLFLLQRLIHAIDDGSGSLKYALCDESLSHTATSEHTHFHCEHCHRTFCLKRIAAPVVPLPNGFQLYSMNYVLKGLCPRCSTQT